MLKRILLYKGRNIGHVEIMWLEPDQFLPVVLTLVCAKITSILACREWNPVTLRVDQWLHEVLYACNLLSIHIIANTDHVEFAKCK